MPVRAEEYRRRELHPIFQMNLPEGYVLEQLRNRLAKTVKVDPMLLLALSGSSAPIGRVFVASDFKKILEETYGAFSHAAVAPLRQLNGNEWVLELFHGPPRSSGRR